MLGRIKKKISESKVLQTIIGIGAGVISALMFWKLKKLLYSIWKKGIVPVSPKCI